MNKADQEEIHAGKHFLNDHPVSGGSRSRCGSKNKADAAREFQLILLRNGASILEPDDTLIDSDSERNVFNYGE